MAQKSLQGCQDSVPISFQVTSSEEELGCVEIEVLVESFMLPHESGLAHGGGGLSAFDILRI